MKRVASILLALVMVFSAVSAMAEAACPAMPSPAAMLTAVGSALVEKMDETALLSFDITANGLTVAEAQANLENMKQIVLTALKNEKISSKDVRSTHYDVSPVYEYHYSKLTETQLLTGYNVESRMEIRVPDIDIAGRIVDEVHAAGVDCDCDLVFEAVEDPSAYDKALALAVQEAQRKAKLIADASGLTLDNLISLEEITVQAGLAMVEITYAVH